MSAAASINSIISACNKGINSAYKSYEEMSTERLWSAPEYFITSLIAIEIANSPGSKYVTLEGGIHNSLECAGATGKGKFHKAINLNGRSDIVIWWAGDTPRAIIEVKNRVSNKKNYEKDIHRIMHMLNRKSDDSSLQFGVFAFYTSTTKSSKSSASVILDNRLKKIEENVIDLLGDNFTAKFYPESKHSDKDDKSWCACSILIRKKST